MKNHERILKSIVGDEGYQTLEKAIFRRQTQSVADPLELYLPLMVVPRAILSWLVQNIQPLKIDEHKEIEMPGRSGVKLYVQKQATDVYRGEIIEGGKVIHTFDKQSLPSIGGHLMTVFEDYNHLQDAQKEEPKKEAVKELEAALEEAPKPDSSAIVRTIMNMNGCSIESADPAAIQAMAQLASVQALTQTVGKLVDALVAKKVEGMNKEELKGESHQVKETEMPPKQQKSKDVIQDMKPAEYIERTRELTSQESVAEAPEPKVVKEGEQAADAEPKKESIAKDEIPGQSKKKKKSLRTAYGSALVTGPIVGAPAALAPAFSAAPAAGGAAMGKGSDMGTKPRAASAPLRAAHEKGVHADLSAFGTGKLGMSGAGREVRLGGSANMGNAKDWHRRRLSELQTQKPNLPKAELEKGAVMPGGAGMAKMPKPQLPPNPAVAASNNPAGAAAKQSLASAKGKQMMPVKKPTVNKPLAPQTQPKMAMKGEYDVQNPPGKEIPKILDRPASHPGHRNLRSLIKAPRAHQVSESELYQKCEHCGQAEFSKSESGPKLTPCACFMVLTKDEEGNPKDFVAIRKNERGYEIKFSPGVEPEDERAFLLTMKAKALLKKRFGVDV